MSIGARLRHHILVNNINIKDIARVGNFNVSSLRTALNTEQMGFEKFCKIAVIVGFDLFKNENYTDLLTRYNNIDGSTIRQRIEVYKEAFKDRVLLVDIEDVLHEADHDTAKMALEIKMTKAANMAEQKKAKAEEEKVMNEAVAKEEVKTQPVEQLAQQSVDVPVKDNVNHPSHYCKEGALECITIIKSMVAGLQGIEAVEVANITKYVYRYKDKNGVEDLKKARWYLDNLITNLEA